MKVSTMKSFVKEWYVAFVLLFLWIMFSIFAPEFLSVRNITSIIIFSIPLLAVSLGQNVVILTGGFDLSVGAQVSLMTAILSILMTWNLPASLIIAIIAGLVVGLINGIGITRMDVNPFLMTLGMLFIVEGITLILRPAPGGRILYSFASALTLSIGNIPVVPLLVFLLIAVFGVFTLRRRYFGRLVYAVGDGELNCELRGIDVDRVKLKAYLLSGLMAAIGGIYMAAWAQCGDPKIGGPLLFESITAVMLGGTSVEGGVGKFGNTVFAVLILGSVSSFLFFLGLSNWYRYLINGSILVVVVAVQQYIKLGR